MLSLCVLHSSLSPLRNAGLYVEHVCVCSTGVCFAVVNQYFSLQSTSTAILPQVNSFSRKTHSIMLQGLYLKMKQIPVLLIRYE